MRNRMMQSRTVHLMFAATAGVATLALYLPLAAGDPPMNTPAAAQQDANSKESLQTLRLPNGFQEVDLNAASGVKSTLVSLTDRAVTKDSYNSWFSSFLSDLAARDKARAQEFKNPDQAKLNGVIGQIQTKWKAKYGQDFRITDKNLVFGDQFAMVQGKVNEPTVAVRSWPLAESGQAIAAGASATPMYANDTIAKEQADQESLSKGTEVAVIRFPAENGIPDINVSLIHQTMTGWHVAIPSDRKGEQIYNDLYAHLNYIAMNEAQWPADADAAYRMVARNVLAALYGVQAPAGLATVQ